VAFDLFAVCVYVLVAIIAKTQVIARNPSEILQILGIMLFKKAPVNQALTAKCESALESDDRNQFYCYFLTSKSDNSVFSLHFAICRYNKNGVRCRD